MKKVLMDLHPCFDGYAGIPQDTRITFGLLANSEQFEVGGHLFDSSHGTTCFPWDKLTEKDELINQMSEYIIGLNQGFRRYDYGVSGFKLMRSFYELLCSYKLGRQSLRLLIDKGFFKPGNKLHEIDADFFHDFIWRSYFEKSLSVQEKNKVIGKKFVGSSMSRALMLRVLRDGKFHRKIDASGWDAYISQTPFPGKIKGGAKSIVRFHDAVPIQNPHTINNPHEHHQVVSRSLRLNSSDSDFICNSNSTREQLLSIYPKLDNRVHVVHCCVPNIFKESSKQSVADIVSKCTNTKLVQVSGFSDVVKYKKFIEENFNDEYFIAVGTIEPRKNYHSILDGWNRYRKLTGKDTKLVIVGNSGWGEDQLLSEINTHSVNGDLFLLNNVSQYELVDLYTNAQACIVASYTEGFSYSGIEAMRCNIPVVASDIPVHREVYADNAFYFNPYAKDELVSSLSDVINLSSEQRVRIVGEAKKFSMRYNEETICASWETVMNDILK